MEAPLRILLLLDTREDEPLRGHAAALLQLAAHLERAVHGRLGAQHRLSVCGEPDSRGGEPDLPGGATHVVVESRDLLEDSLGGWQSGRQTASACAAVVRPGWLLASLAEGRAAPTEKWLLDEPWSPAPPMHHRLAQLQRQASEESARHERQPAEEGATVSPDVICPPCFSAQAVPAGEWRQWGSVRGEVAGGQTYLTQPDMHGHDLAVSLQPDFVRPAEEQPLVDAILEAFDARHARGLGLGARMKGASGPQRLSFADSASLCYRYGLGRYVNVPLEWGESSVLFLGPMLRELAERATEDVLGDSGQLGGRRFNYCLVQLYQGGSDFLAWHKDNDNSKKRKAGEPLSGQMAETPVASCSLGAERLFAFAQQYPRRAAKPVPHVGLRLKSRSLLTMQPACNGTRGWYHSLMQEPGATASQGQAGWRINLTFRVMEAPR